MRDNNFSALVDAENWTRERHGHAEFRKTKRGYTFGAHPEAELLNEPLFVPLTRDRGAPAWRRRKGALWDCVHPPTPHQRAFIALSAVGHYIATADDDDPLEESKRISKRTSDRILKCRLTIGRAIYAE